MGKVSLGNGDRRAEGITFMFDQDSHPSREINQPGKGVDYRAESPTNYSGTPTGDGDSRPPGNSGDTKDRDDMDASSAKVIPVSMGETLRDQLTYQASVSTSRVFNRYREKRASLKFEVLPKGAILYRGTPYGKKKFPSGGAAWFTPDREVARGYSKDSWKGRLVGYVEQAQKVPSIRKYRVLKPLRLFSASHNDLGGPLAHYAEKAGLGEYSLLKEAIENLGWWSSAEWRKGFSYFDEADLLRLEKVVPTLKVLSQFEDTGEFLEYICKRTDFQGWIATYEDGGSEVLLCDPSTVLKASARLNPYKNKKEEEEAELKRKEEKRISDAEWAEEFNKKREQEALEKQQEDEFWRRKNIVLETYFPPAWGSGIDYTDKEVQDTLKNWDKYVTDEDLVLYNRHNPVFRNSEPSRLAAAVSPNSLPEGVKIYTKQTSIGKGGWKVSAYQERENKRALEVGHVWFSKPLGMGNCLGAYEVQSSGVEIPKLGPLLYDVALELAGKHGLMSDRRDVSPSARRVWDYYLNSRSDVRSVQLDDELGSLNENESDDCNQSSAGTAWLESSLSKVYYKHGTPVLDALRKRGLLVEGPPPIQDFRILYEASPTVDDVLNLLENQSSRVASRYKSAVTMAQLLSNSGPSVLKKAPGVSLTPKRFSPEKGFWVFSAKGSKGESYLIKIKGIFKKKMINLGKAEIQCSCSCPFWQWQGPEYYAKTNKYLYGKPRGTASSPDQKDPTGKNWICKHIAAALAQAKTYQLQVAPIKGLKSKRGSLVEGFEITQLREPNPLRVSQRYAATLRPKMRLGETYAVFVGDREIGTVGYMNEDEYLMDLLGRPYKVISGEALSSWLGKMPPNTGWRKR